MVSENNYDDDDVNEGGANYHAIAVTTTTDAIDVIEECNYDERGDGSIMECGASLAEGAWSMVPPSTAAMVASAVCDVSSLTSSSSSPPPPSPPASAGRGMLSDIRDLRARLAADVVMVDHHDDDDDDDDDDDNGGNRRHRFPTFVSPYEFPTGGKGSGIRGGGGRGGGVGMSIPLVYCDQTASQRPVSSIENYIRRVSMPCHANTHTNITFTGSQSTAFVSESRQIVAESTGARISGKASCDVVLFGGNGVTGVVGLLIDVLDLRALASSSSSSSSSSDGADGNGDGWNAKRPVIFVGPHEHHSNLLPWRESGCEVVSIPERADDGTVDLAELERLLKLPRYGISSGRLRIGAFAAVSNVTGLIADVDSISILLHRHGALAVFDYASGAPYVKMDMNPSPPRRATTGPSSSSSSSPDDDPSKDAIYFSPHKLYGGTSTPGVLVIKKRLISQTIPPTVSGGGTVFYVTNQSHRFLSNRIERYEGGTPDGIGIQRVGLALLAGRRVASEYERIVKRWSSSSVAGHPSNGEVQDDDRPPWTLLEYECSMYDRVAAELKKSAPNLILLGYHERIDADEDKSINHQGNVNEKNASSPCAGRHLPIFSFLIRCGRRFLHYNFVCAILNDVFGIQSRGGCQCAGPYSQRLLGLTSILNNASGAEMSEEVEVPSDDNRKIECALLRSDRPCELLRPGYTRLSLPFKGLREEEADYVVRALIWVARNGWALLPQYRCDHRTGEWRHWSRRGKPLGKSERLWLSHYDILATVPPPSSTGGKVINEGVDSSVTEENILASRSRLDQAMDNANAILEATKRDPRFLSEVEKMNPATGMLGSGSHNDSGDGGVDNTLEDLRWYVYPQEVSKYLRDGLKVVPDTFDDDALVGAINVRMDGKRKNNLVVESTLITEPVSAVNTTVSIVIESQPGLIPFQEGDHLGEASYDEIKAGYEDGELGETCAVYSQSRDEWIIIAKFLQEYQSGRTATAVVDVLEEESAICRKRNLSAMTDSSLPGRGGIITEAIIDSPFCDTMQSINRLPPAVEKREKKKPSRNSSQWGQRPVPHSAPSVYAIEPPPSLAPNSNEVTKTESNIVSLVESSPVANAISNKSMKNKGKIKPPPKMMRYVTQAMIQWDMVQEGDRLLLGLSGGKDSLSLLHVLLEYQKKVPIKFDIEVCTIDPMTPSFDPSPLIPYVEGLGLKYHYIRDDIVGRAASSGKDGKTVSSLCAFCARMKRGNLYTCARKNNCNKLVLAQHLDDCAESFFMSIMHNGFVRTMKANYKINQGDVSVIRPLVYCRESLMTEFARNAKLPVINENCPACFEEPKERARVKKLLSREETLNTNLYDQIRRALIPVMHEDSTSIMRCYLEETIARSRKIPASSKKGKILNGAEDEAEANSAELKIARAASNSEDNKSTSQNSLLSLASVSEEELIAELARRRADKYKLFGAMKRLTSNENDYYELPADETGQMCSLTGGDGMIPCRELME